MPDPRTEDPWEHVREVIQDFGNIDFLPHPGDKIHHKCGAVTEFRGHRETPTGPLVTACTLLPSPITRIQIEGTVQL